MEWIEVKTILQTVSYGKDWFGVQYNMNLYKGCHHGCIYCDSRSACYHVENFDVVRAKKDAILLLERELISKRKKGIVGMGSMSDPYNAFEEKESLTRKALILLSKFGYGVCLQTKSDLIVRDIDLFIKMNQRTSVCIGITITTFNDSLAKIIEPYAPPSSKRWEAVQTLSKAGLFVGIMMTPILPFITDTEENIKKMVYLAHQNGAQFIYTYLGVTLRENQREYYYDKISKNFLGVKEKYQKVYGNKYLCISQHPYLWKIFTNECEKYGILYKMEDMIKAYKKENKQISFLP